ncbi:hypothetical protein QBC37DRAFT_447042 [Rhypophila decipiens]|uniref:Uncharacterized protein n=1 Tax=Rhypophila decipiens TaxID=261697 RepID=A0AAN6Y283_9PEZI|nr:hypothetical protein QBC37DRAFT_447042 [Rhypophila decipiens]
MELVYRYLSLLLALLTVGVAAQSQCTSYGVDYQNQGTYSIDSTSNQYFSFITVFQGCSQETISPVLVAPDGNEYACSAIKTQPAGQQVTSTCGIPYSAMFSGTWKIIVAGNQIATQRVIQLVVGAAQTTWVTVTPTVVIGVTTTAGAKTVQTTIQQTQTLILVPSTVTAACNGGTRTVTVYPQGPTVTVVSTIFRTVTDGQKTSYLTTTATATAICHLPTSEIPMTLRPATKRIQGSNQRATDKKREVAATAAVAAVTSTYTQTTYTVTSTIRTTIPARTVTEQVLRTVTATITPAPSTVCGGGGGPAATVTVNRGNPTTTTQTNLAYQTTHLTGTVWVGQTQYTTITNSASATACWRSGGWFGL